MACPGTCWGPCSGGGRGRLKSAYGKTDVAEVVGDDEVGDELFGELGVHLEDVEQVVAVDLVQVAVGHGAHVAARLADRLLLATDRLAEHVVLTCSVRRSQWLDFSRPDPTRPDRYVSERVR